MISVSLCDSQDDNTSWWNHGQVQVHIADHSYKAHAIKGIDVWNYDVWNIIKDTILSLTLHKHIEESLQQVVSASGAYDSSKFLDYARENENRNPQVPYPGAQIPGIQQVFPCSYIPVAPASPCNIIHCEPIN
jgi:hypothetical protein